MADKLMYIPNDNTQNKPSLDINYELGVETLRHSTIWTIQNSIK